MIFGLKFLAENIIEPMLFVKGNNQPCFSEQKEKYGELLYSEN